MTDAVVVADPSGARFPDEVMLAMHEAAVTATCIPVRLDQGDWAAGLFVIAPAGAPCLRRDGDGLYSLPAGPFAVQFEADLHAHEHGTVFELDVQIRTPVVPLNASLLFVTGHASAHFELLDLLASRQELRVFIGDEFCRVLWQQSVPLSDAHRSGIRSLLDEAVRRDAMIRLSGRYDPDAAFQDAHRKRRIASG